MICYQKAPTSFHKHFWSDLATGLNTTEAELFALIDLGAIYVNNQRLERPAIERIEENDFLRIHRKPKRYPKAFTDWKDRVVFENADFVVINKPAAVPTHATLDNTVENATAQMQLLLQQKLYVTHRLDTCTQGLLTLAKTQEFQRQFNQMLQQGLVTKFYRAELERNFDLPAQIYTHYLEPSPRAPKNMQAIAQPGWLECRLRVLNCGDSKIEIELLTGRTHQIRAQLSCMGYPILGDKMYGSIKGLGAETIALKAFKLQFLGHSFTC